MPFAVEIRAKSQLRNSKRLPAKMDRDLRLAWKVLARDLNRIQARSFQRQVTPWGRPWPKLSPVTLELRRRGGLFGRRRRSSGRRILHVTGNLEASSRWVPFKRKVQARVVGRARRYAGVHMFGNRRNRLPNNSRGNRAPIPARPYWPVVLRGGRAVLRMSLKDRRRMDQLVGKAAAGQLRIS